MKPSGCRETVGRLHLFHAIRVHVAIVSDSYTPSCGYYVKFICWLVTIVRDSFTPACSYYVMSIYRLVTIVSGSFCQFALPCL